MDDDEIKPISFDDFKDRKPRAPKRRSVIPPVESASDNPATLAAALVADSTSLTTKTVEDIAELAIRRMANVVLLGGEEFLPKSLNEASNSAKVWASIASLERARLAGRGGVMDDEDPVARMAKRALAELRPLQKRQS